MKSGFLSVNCQLLTVNFLVLAACSSAPKTPSESALPSWLVGAWIGEDGRAAEHWTSAAGALFGVGFPLRGPAFEVLIIQTSTSGKLTFTAWPGGDGGVV